MKYTFFITLFLIGCNNLKNDPQQIVDLALNASGSNLLNSAVVEFEFRGREYGVQYNTGSYEMVRLWEDSVKGIIRDEVTNNGFIREVDGKKVVVPDSMAFKYTNSINSVIYFALLPYRLNDQAVNKKYLGVESIKGQDYYKIEVTFDQEGGGKDHEDVFIYWINIKDFYVDYFAYSYEVDGGGRRFREAINERFINGVRIVDHKNYEANVSVSLNELGKLFEENKLKLLSIIELENVAVEIK